MGAHKDHVAEAQADGPRGRGECTEVTACTERGCAPWVVSCEAGRCAIERGTF